MRALLTATIIMFSLSCWAQSNPPAPATAPLQQSQGQQANKPQSNTATNPQPTPAAATVPTVVASSASAPKPQKADEKNSAEWWAVRVASIAALIAAIAAVFGGYQVCIARDTARRQLRAYVLPDNDTVITCVEKMVRVTVNIKNFGQTPAKHVMIALRVRQFELPLSEELTFPEFKGGTRSPLGPGGKAPSRASLSEPLTDQQLKSILHRDWGVFIWGRINYFDVFDVEQTTNFKFLCTGDDFTNRDLMVCEDGNNAD